MLWVLRLISKEPLILEATHCEPLALDIVVPVNVVVVVVQVPAVSERRIVRCGTPPEADDRLIGEAATVEVIAGQRSESVLIRSATRIIF